MLWRRPSVKVALWIRVHMLNVTTHVFSLNCGKIVTHAHWSSTWASQRKIPTLLKTNIVRSLLIRSWAHHELIRHWLSTHQCTWTPLFWEKANTVKIICWTSTCYWGRCSESHHDKSGINVRVNGKPAATRLDTKGYMLISWRHLLLLFYLTTPPGAQGCVWDGSRYGVGLQPDLTSIIKSLNSAPWDERSLR